MVKIWSGKEFIVDEPIKPESLFNFITSRFIDKRPDWTVAFHLVEAARNEFEIATKLLHPPFPCKIYNISFELLARSLDNSSR